MARSRRAYAARTGQPAWVRATLVTVLMLVVLVLGYAGGTYLVRVQQTPATSSVASNPSRDAARDPCPTSTPLIGDGLPVKDAVILNVYNATLKQGLAAQAALDFKREGFRILSIANDPQNAKVEGVAEIRFGPNGRKAAKLVEYYLAGAKMVELERDDTVIDVVLGPAYTQLADGEAVASFLAEPTPSGSACPATASPQSGSSQATPSTSATVSP
jgi:hypothetical protein